MADLDLTPEQLQALKDSLTAEADALSAPPSAAAPAPGTTVMVNDAGERVNAAEYEMGSYVGQGYRPEAEQAAADAQASAEQEYGGFGSGVLGRMEAAARGATVGLSGLASDIGTGIASSLSGYQGPRAAGQGIDAGIDDRSTFALGMEQGREERLGRQAALGNEGLAWEMGGALGSSLLTGGASAAAAGGSAVGKAGLAAMPNMLLERASTQVAAKLLGDQAVKAGFKAGVAAIGTRTLARGAAGALEGGVGSGILTAAENVQRFVEDPKGAVEDVAISALGGLAIGGAVGATWGLGEGLIKQARQAAGGVAAAVDTAPPPVPAAREVSPAQVLQEAATRPLRSAELPEPPRSGVQKAAAYQRALAGGADEAVEKGSREVRDNLDRVREITSALRQEAGIGQKRLVNDLAARNEIATDLVSALDEDGVAREAARMAKFSEARDVVQKQRDVLQSGYEKEAAGYEAKRASWSIAKEQAEKAARDAEDALKTPDAKKTKTAQAQLTKAQARLEKLAGQEPKPPTTPKLPELPEAPPMVSPPRQLTRVEHEARGMFDGLIKSIDDYSAGLVGEDAAGLSELRKTLVGYRDISYEAMRRGDYGAAYDTMDQGARNAVGRYVRKAARKGLPGGAEFGKRAYLIPQQFLENEDTWRTLAQRQKTVNPFVSAAAAADDDDAWKALWRTTGEKDVDDWLNAKGANSSSVGGLMGQMGAQSGESAEEAVRRNLRARLAAAQAQADAWGTPKAKELVAELAKKSSHIEDIMDNTARARKDFQAAQAALSTGQTIAALMAMGGTLGVATGTPELAVLGLPAVGGRWLFGQVARYRGNVFNKVIGAAGKAAKLSEDVLRSAAKYSPEALRTLSANERAQTIKEAQDVQRLGTEAAGRVLASAEAVEKVDPKLAQELIAFEQLRAQYLTSKLPPSTGNSPLALPTRPSRAAARTLDRTIQAMRNPSRALDRIGDGKATHEDVDMVKTLYPTAFAALKREIMEEVRRTPQKPRSARQIAYLTRVTGEPLTPAYERLGAAQARAQAATAGAEEAGKPMDGGDGRTARAPMKLDPENHYGTRADRIMASQ